MLDINEMIVVAFLMIEIANGVRFFKKIFLVANVSPKKVFEMLFLTFSSVNVNFLNQKLC